MIETASAAVVDAIDRLVPASLADVDAVAALQDRVDRKYVLHVDAVADLVRALAPQLSVLEIDGRRAFGYESIYFDTADFESYLGAAYRRRRRFKVRTRCYLDSERTMLEVKTRSVRGRTIKQRRSHDAERRDELGRAGRAFVDEATGITDLAERLRPTLVSSYRRSTLADLHRGARCTVDGELRCSDPNGAAIELPDRLIVETKSPGAPSIVDRWLWRHGHRPETVSKFGTGLAALHPELPANKWHRTLERHIR